MATELRPERQLPQNLEAELCLLGSILLDNEAMGDVVSLVDPQSFYSPANQLLYEIFVRCFEMKKPLDAVILHDELARRDALARVGGAEYIAQVMEAVPSPANAEYYARIVREAAVKRKLLSTVSLIEREIYHPTMETDELLEMSERSIFEVVQRKGDRRDLQIGEILKQAIKKISDIHDRRGRLTGLATGFFELDDALGGGMHPSQLIIIAGRPGMGKTSFVMRVVEHVGLVEKKGVLFFSLEMDQQNIAQNMLCAHARISSWNLRKGLISTEDWQKLLLAAGAFYEAPIFLDDSTSLSVLEIR
ncbi:MAG: DnaB-like helicase C-terminal domain-containing protein, partial [Planctomycetota bacterium]